MKKARIIAVVAIAAAAGTVSWLVATGRLGGRRGRARELTLYGNIDIRQADLGFRVAGRLDRMHLEEGQVVTTGQVMAELETRPFDDQVHTAQAQALVQQATLDKLLTGSRPEEIARAKAAVDDARAAKVLADTELARTRNLVEGRALPGQNLDHAVSGSRSAGARLAQAQESYRLAAIGPRSEDIAAARAALAVAQANVASAQTSRDDAILYAPSDGVVTSRVREPGAIVTPNDVVYVETLTHSIWVRAYVGEADLGKVAPGTAVTVATDAGGRYAAHVGFVSPVAEFTPKTVETPELRTALVYRLRVIVELPDRELRQGMPVTVHVPLGAAVALGAP